MSYLLYTKFIPDFEIHAIVSASKLRTYSARRLARSAFNSGFEPFLEAMCICIRFSGFDENFLCHFGKKFMTCG